MTGCGCSGEVTYRVSDERPVNLDSPQETEVRLRCVECGGKGGYAPVSALVALGFSEDEVMKPHENKYPFGAPTITLGWYERPPSDHEDPSPGELEGEEADVL